jgi:hypothetical protein
MGRHPGRGQRPRLAGVRFVAQYEGGFKVFCAVFKPSGASERVNEFCWAGSTDTATLVTSGLAVPKRHSPEFNAIVLARATGCRNRPRNIDGFFQSRAGGPGSGALLVRGAVVRSGFDLLIDPAGGEDGQVNVRQDLLNIEGVGRTTNRARACLTDNAKRPGGQQA